MQIDDDSYMHLRIFRILPSRHGEVELEEILEDKKDADPLEAFGIESGAYAVEAQ